MAIKCGFFNCKGCSGCDPDVEENNLKRIQRRRREEDALRAAGKPTMRVKLGDTLTKRPMR
jgi:hypothetical protein